LLFGTIALLKGRSALLLLSVDLWQSRSIAAADQERSIVEVRRLIELDDRSRMVAGETVQVVGRRQIERWRSTV
jgi:hypothetical protein